MNRLFVNERSNQRRTPLDRRRRKSSKGSETAKIEI